MFHPPENTRDIELWPGISYRFGYEIDPGEAAERETFDCPGHDGTPPSATLTHIDGEPIMSISWALLNPDDADDEQFTRDDIEALLSAYVVQESEWDGT